MRLGFHASHEQFAPSLLLELARRAEDAGFDALFSSDHFHPWTPAQGQSGFSFAWMGAALQATRLPGRVICCPFGRYHPAVVAQAAATLAEMFEGRFALAIGSGQALNEHITGRLWPEKAVRNQRLKESAEIIKRLWAGETVTYHGGVQVADAKLYTLPKQTPLLIGAAVSDETAEFAGGWADALVTTSRPLDAAKKTAEAFRRGGGVGKPLLMKVGLSYARTEEAALRQAHQQWAGAAFSNNLLTEIPSPLQFEEMGRRVRPEDMGQGLRISASIEQHIQWIRDDLEAGYEEIYLHNVGTNQEEFVDDFGKYVLPQFKR